MDGPFGDYRGQLIRISEAIAGRPGETDPAEFLRRFRIVYQHLAATVETSLATSGMTPFGYPEPFPRSPDQIREGVRELLDQTDQGLTKLNAKGS